MGDETAPAETLALTPALISVKPGPYNPLDIAHLGESIGTALLTAEPTRLDLLPKFYGAGVYAIYYTGNDAPYETLGAANRNGAFTTPIYVGKAVPDGARKGVAVATASGGRALSGRLSNHAVSVSQATNLKIEDFWARWLVTEAIWIPLGEGLLISRFAPVWNALVDGFGNHAPGAGRVDGALSRWDTLHPGRSTEPVLWSDAYKARDETPGDLEQLVRTELGRRVIDAAPTPNDSRPIVEFEGDPAVASHTPKPSSH